MLCGLSLAAQLAFPLLFTNSTMVPIQFLKAILVWDKLWGAEALVTK